MIICEKLEQARNKTIVKNSDKPLQERTVEILFKSSNIQETAKMIKNMWELRKGLRDDLRPPWRDKRRG